MFDWFYNTTEPEPEPLPPEPAKWSYTQIMFYIFICWWVIRVLERHGLITFKKKNKKRRRKKSLKITENNDLSEIIGLESVKEEIRYYMDFINNKKSILIGM